MTTVIRHPARPATKYVRAYHAATAQRQLDAAQAALVCYTREREETYHAVRCALLEAVALALETARTRSLIVGELRTTTDQLKQDAQLALQETLIRSQSRMLFLRNGSSIEFASGAENPDVLRGRHYDAVVLVGQTRWCVLLEGVLLPAARMFYATIDDGGGG